MLKQLQKIISCQLLIGGGVLLGAQLFSHGNVGGADAGPKDKLDIDAMGKITAALTPDGFVLIPTESFIMGDQSNPPSGLA